LVTEYDHNIPDYPTAAESIQSPSLSKNSGFVYKFHYREQIEAEINIHISVLASPYLLIAWPNPVKHDFMSKSMPTD